RLASLRVRPSQLHIADLIDALHVAALELEGNVDRVRGRQGLIDVLLNENCRFDLGVGKLDVAANGWTKLTAVAASGVLEPPEHRAAVNVLDLVGLAGVGDVEF